LAEFATVDKTDYPREPNKNEDTSANFTPPYKVATGDTRGDLRIKGVITIADTDNTIRLVMGFKKDGF